MRQCFTKVQSHLSKLSVMGVTEISKTSTKHINDFSAQQMTQIERFQVSQIANLTTRLWCLPILVAIHFWQDNFREFRALIIKLVLDACKTTFAEQGFSYDDYYNELAAQMMPPSAATSHYRGGAGGGAAQAGSTLSGISQLKNTQQQPVKKLTFIEQANKRQCCIKVSGKEKPT